MADVPLTESDEVTIADAAGTNKLTVNTDGSTNTQVQPVVVTGSFTGSTQQIDVSTIGRSSVQVQIYGAFSGTISFFGSVTGSNLVSLKAFNEATGTYASSATTAGMYRLPASGLNKVSLISSAWASGTASVAANAGIGSVVVPAFGSVGVTSNSTGNNLTVNADGSINVSGIATSNFPVVIVNGKIADANGNIATILTTQVTYATPTVGDQATAVVSATAGKKIRVFAIAVSLGINSANTYLRDGSGGTQLSVLYLRTTGGSVPSFYFQGAPINTFVFQTTSGTALVANCSTTTGPVSVQITYTLV
jgi:hypothetical protein